MTAKRKILELNAFDMDAAEGLDPGVAALVTRRKRVFGPASMLFYARPLNLVRGEDVWLIGADGTRYLDAYNNVASVGHCHARVVAGCAILEAIIEIWPAKNLGVADRGIREGILRSLMARDGWPL